jgi:hypothetical protein
MGGLESDDNRPETAIGRRVEPASPEREIVMVGGSAPHRCGEPSLSAGS